MVDIGASSDIVTPLLLLLLSLVVAFLSGLSGGDRRPNPFPDHFDGRIQALTAWNEARVSPVQRRPLDLVWHGAIDRRPLATRVLVWGGLVIGIVLLHALVVGLLGAIFRTSTNPAIPLMATLVVALLVP